MLNTTPPTPITTGILDVHHSDGRIDLEAMERGGIVALIHKATQGKDWRDPAFAGVMRRMREGRSTMLRGAYHFGSNSCLGEEQADFFLGVVAQAVGTAADDVLLALDFEHNPDTKSGDMSADNARRFVERVHRVTGRWPLFYTGANRLKHLATGSAETDPLARCPLWLAQYGEPPRGASIPSTWPAGWSLWQYSDVGYGPRDRKTYPRDTPGVRVADRSCYRGTVEELRTWWMTAGRTPA